MKIKLLFILLLFLSSGLFAQSKKLKKLYRNATQALNREDYTQALLHFQEILDYDGENSIIENSHFYYALCYYKTNQISQAKTAFEGVLKKYPNFTSKEEVNYFLADIAFRSNDWDNAFKALQKIQSTDFQKDTRNIKAYYFQQCDLVKLRLLQQTYPKDTLLAQTLVDKIAFSSEKEDDYSLLENLLIQYKLEAPKYRKLEKVMRKRTTYKVAVLMPFEYHNLKKKDTTSISRLSTQLYQGMRVAKRELDSTQTDFKIQLFAYDVNRENEMGKIDTMLINKELRDVDFVIGPISDNAHKKLTEATTSEKINIIQPITYDAKFLLTQYNYLYEPSQETQAQQANEFAKAKFPNKTLLIFYDNLPKNRVFASIYKEKAETLGLKVLAFEQVTSTDLSKIESILNKNNSTEVGSILLSSTSQLIAAELIKLLKDKIYDVPVFAPDAILKFQEIDYADFEKLNFHFIYPDYIDVDTKEALKFKKAYLDSVAKQDPPSNYAYLGYEMLHFIAKILAENGTRIDYTSALRKTKPQNGVVTDTLDFSVGHNNQFVPILKIKDGEISLVN